MSTKKKKPARRPQPQHRTIYDSALDKAQAELARAINQRTDALMKLDQLSRRIPFLENLVTALVAETKPQVSAPQPSQYAPESTSPTVAPPPPTTPPTMDQETFLQRFIPKPGRLTTAGPVPSRPQPDGTSTDENEFLTD